MLETVTPTRFHAAVTSGRTRPARLECEKVNGATVEVIGKFSGGCDRKAVGLAMEVVAACLAADLGLPVPQPYLLDLRPAFIATVTDQQRKALMIASSPIAFGSTEAGNGFRIWSKADRIGDHLVPQALAVLCFDAFVANDDRRETNPNLLVKGREIRIIDHETAFVHKMLIGWQQPWIPGALAPLTTPGHHIFYAGLKGRAIDTAPIEQSWNNITDAKLHEYRGSVPQAWAADTAITDAIDLIRSVRDNIAVSLAEVRRVLA
jgi:HipA-like kinase